MVEKLQNEILDKINNSEEVKKIEFLKDSLKNNKEYNKLMSLSKEDNSNIIEIRKKLFSISEYKEYMKLTSEIKLNFLKINNIIVSIVDDK